MPTKNLLAESQQMRLFMDELTKELNPKKPIYKLRQLMDYAEIRQIAAKYYKDKNTGRPKHEGQIMVCLLILQALHNTTDEDTVENFEENLYWQYFCGLEHPEKGHQIAESCILRFRRILGEEGLQEILAYTQKLALKAGVIKKKSSQRPNRHHHTREKRQISDRHIPAEQSPIEPDPAVQRKLNKATRNLSKSIRDHV